MVHLHEEALDIVGGRDLDQEETLALYTKGRDAWNAWADTLLEKRRVLEATPPVDANDQQDNMAAWQAEARADFSALTLTLRASTPSKSGEAPKLGEPAENGNTNSCRTLDGANFDFSGYIFPDDIVFHRTHFCGNALFRDAKFMGAAQFLGAQFDQSADFSNAIFSGGAAFADAQFKDAALFSAARFEASASFIGAQFKKAILFNDAQFSKGTHFRLAHFEEQAAFNAAKFRGEAADFNDAHFGGDAWFNGAVFGADGLFDATKFDRATHFIEARFEKRALFRYAVFQSYTTFERAHFATGVTFRAMHGEGAFELGDAQLGRIPNFHQAHFTEAPRLDNLRLLPGVESASFFKSIVGAGQDKNTVAKYRALRRLAVQGHDHDNERLFLKGEIRARRFQLDMPWHAAFWLGLAYDVLSDFGGSIARPIYWGLASVLVFAAIYYYLVFATCGSASVEAFDHSLYLSLKNAALLITWDNATDLPGTSDCLMAAKKVSTRFALGLTLVQIGQKVASAALLFLVLLAVRNRFRIR